ncbi:MAG TPA: UV DNA damage repair endonuclease UvsE [Anaerolineae bacterium]|nr:UV DNA damage repair endonuclease UvsE [Anaerolineae bacterium]HOQ97774.1 UV DNA damage repair endonuclease UvsE [Anaerolineae bacterium]HPL29532.1 UV DNA damage repair endonuclease UvsE [Anaerolineae bacterium]
MRLGFAVKVLGRPELKSHDTRRWQSSPHLRVSLKHLREVLRYLQQAQIHMYRMSSDLAPYLTHPDLPQFHSQLEESAADLAAVGALARALDIRLSLHPAQYIVLNSDDEEVARKAALDLVAQARILDLMQQGPEAVVVVHGDSGAGGLDAAGERFVQRFRTLPAETQARLGLENDEKVFALPDTLRVHKACGIRLVFDLLHFHVNNPERRPVVAALRAALSTWPAGVTPKIHISSPRTEMHIDERRDPETGKKLPVVRPPQWSQHSDYANPFEVIAALEEVRRAGLRPFDIMLELKAKDLGLLQLRQDFQRFAPELAELWQ